MTAEVPKGWFVLLLEQLATQPALLDAAAASSGEEWDRRRRGRPEHAIRETKSCRRHGP